MANKIFNGLPSEAYTDKKFWDRERNSVFTNNDINGPEVNGIYNTNGNNCTFTDNTIT